MADEINEPIEGGKDSPLENTSSDIDTSSPQSPPPPEPPNDNHYESKQPHSQSFESTVEKATNLGKKKKIDEDEEPIFEQQYKSQHVRDEETRQSYVPIKSSSFEEPKKVVKTGNTTDYASTAQTTTQIPKHEPAPQPFRTQSSNSDLFDQMNRENEKPNTSGIDFDAVSRPNELSAKKKQIADYQKTQPSMDAEIEAKRKENRDKQTLEDYNNNRSKVGKAMDLFSREHAQELGYKVEKKIEGHLTERRAEKELENKRRIEPLLIQNDKDLREGKISKEMHTVRKKQYIQKMEDTMPIEQKIGGVVKREANSAFGILNEAMTSPKGRADINRQRVASGKEPLTSAMEGNSIAATFARGIASTTQQLREKPAKSQPMIFTRGSVAPAFVGSNMNTLPTSSSFYGVMPSARQPRAAKGAKGKAGQLAQKSGSQIDFGGIAPISFGGAGFGLFGRGQPAPTPPPPAAKPHARKKR